MPKNKAKDSETVTVRLTEEQREYLNKRKEQGHTKSGYIEMLLDEAMLRDGKAHSSIVKTMTNLTNKCQKLKRKAEYGNNIGLKEIQELERQVNRLWEKL